MLVEESSLYLGVKFPPKEDHDHCLHCYLGMLDGSCMRASLLTAGYHQFYGWWHLSGSDYSCPLTHFCAACVNSAETCSLYKFTVDLVSYVVMIDTWFLMQIIIIRPVCPEEGRVPVASHTAMGACCISFKSWAWICLPAGSTKGLYIPQMRISSLCGGCNLTPPQCGVRACWVYRSWAALAILDCRCHSPCSIAP